jgi:uncharacterized iron-regulated membrane protein
VLWMAATGLGMLFKGELDRPVNRKLESVPACHSPRSLDDQVARARVAHPSGVMHLVALEGSPTRSTWVRFANGDTIFLDPCSGRVLGEQNKYGGVFGTLEYLHRLIFLSGAAHAAAGSTALLFATLIVLAGIVFWWPQSLQGLRWSITFSSRPAGRVRLARLHRATGFWVCLILLFSALTGPIDSFHWYQRLIEVATLSPAPAKEPEMKVRGEPRPLPLEALWERVQQVTPHPKEALLLFPRSPRASVEFDVLERSAPTPQAVSYLFVDQYTGDILRFRPYATSSLANKLMAWAIAIHAGQAGLPAQLVLLIGVLAVIVLGYTGYASYLRRRAGAHRARTHRALTSSGSAHAISRTPQRQGSDS